MDVRENRLFLGGLAAEDLAHTFQTPLYVYEEEILYRQIDALKESFSEADPDFHYAMKANNNPAILSILKKAGFFIDAVSPFEVRLALEVGFSPNHIIFTGNNTTLDELQYCVSEGVPVNVGSLVELENYGRIAAGGEVALRINPDVGAGHHHHVITGGPDSKFGVYHNQTKEVFSLLEKYNLKLNGIHCHIGTGILETKDMLEAMEIVLTTASAFPGLQFIDFGGGFGIPYRPESPPLAIKELGAAMARRFEQFANHYGSKPKMKLEPGRFLVAQAGTLLTQVTNIQSTPSWHFIGSDTGLNHLIRPALYGAYHRIFNASKMEGEKMQAVVAGNICESGDVFTQNAKGLEPREITRPKPGDILALCDAGAYGMTLSSQYNMRPRPAEVLVSKGSARIIRTRETYSDLMASFPKAGD